MIKISEQKINNIIEIIKAIIHTKDVEIKNCALIALIEELEDLKNKD